MHWKFKLPEKIQAGSHWTRHLIPAAIMKNTSSAGWSFIGLLTIMHICNLYRDRIFYCTSWHPSPLSCFFVLHSCIRLRLRRQFFWLNIICLFLISRYLVHVAYRVLWLVWLTFHRPVVLQNLIVDELARNYLTFYRNRVFITVFIRPQHLSLSRAMYSYETTFSSISSLSSKQRIGYRCDVYPAC